MSNIGHRRIGGAVLASAKDVDISLRPNSNRNARVGSYKRLRWAASMPEKWVTILENHLIELLVDDVAVRLY